MDKDVPSPRKLFQDRSASLFFFHSCFCLVLFAESLLSKQRESVSELAELRLKVMIIVVTVLVVSIVQVLDQVTLRSIFLIIFASRSANLLFEFFLQFAECHPLYTMCRRERKLQILSSYGRGRKHDSLYRKILVPKSNLAETGRQLRDEGKVEMVVVVVAKQEMKSLALFLYSCRTKQN